MHITPSSTTPMSCHGTARRVHPVSLPIHSFPLVILVFLDSFVFVVAMMLVWAAEESIVLCGTTLACISS